MDLMTLPGAFARWWSMFVLIVAAALLGLGVRLATSPPAYDASVAIQISAPTADNVPLLSSGNNSSSSLRDSLLLVSNDFTFVAESPEVRDLTIQRLNLQGSDTKFSMTIKPVTDSSYLTLTVQARTPQLARAIASTQAQEAIQYYGELRAKPATTTVELLNNQLQATQATITSLQSASASAQSGPNAVALQQATANYQSLLQKRSDALLAAQDAAHVSYIQIVDSAPTPTTPSWLRTFGVTIGLTVVGSLGLAALAVLVMESLYSSRGMRKNRLAGSRGDAGRRGAAGYPDLALASEHGDTYRGNNLGSRKSH